MSAIQFKNVTFSYPGGEPIFQDLTLNLDTAWRLGVTGRNGRGKTTLVKLLTGEIEENSGQVVRPRYVRRFPYEVADKLPPFYEIAEGLEPDVPLWRLTAEVQKIGADAACLFRSFDTLSGGEQTKLQLALLFSAEAEYYLIDEPTDHLDTAGRAAVGRYLSEKPGFLLISHDRTLLDAASTHTLYFTRTGIELERGGISSYLENKRRRENDQKAENERLQKDIKRLNAAAERNAKWSDKVEASKTGIVDYGNVKPDRGHVGHMSAKMMKRAKVIERRVGDMIENKKALLNDVEKTETLVLKAANFKPGALLRFDNVSFSYGEKPCISDVSFSVNAGERLSIVGQNGSGKTTLIKLILGELNPSAGTVTRAEGLNIAYVPQKLDTLSGSLDAFENEIEGVDKTLFRTVLRKFGFDRAMFEKPLSAYSLGQKKLAYLSRAMAGHAHMYIFDELLNYVDIYARTQIESLLISSNAAVVFVEHDAAFVDAVATRTLTLR